MDGRFARLAFWLIAIWELAAETERLRREAERARQQAAIEAQLRTTGVYDRLNAARLALQDPAFSDAFNAARGDRAACVTLDDTRALVVGLLKQPPWQADLTGITFKLAWDLAAKTLSITAVLEMGAVYEAMRVVGALPLEEAGV